MNLDQPIWGHYYFLLLDVHHLHSYQVHCELKIMKNSIDKYVCFFGVSLSWNSTKIGTAMHIDNVTINWKSKWTIKKSEWFNYN